MLCRMSQLRFSLAWMYCVSMGWPSTTTTQSFFETLPSLCNSSNTDILLWKCYRATVNRDSTQWRVMPSRLDTGAYIQVHRRKERLHLSHPYFIFMTRSENTSTDTPPRARTHVLKLLNLHECTRTWTRFDKRAKTYRTTSSSGPLWENVVARITIDDETSCVLNTQKHMTEKDLHQNLPSVRDIRTVLLHFSPVAPN